MVCEAKSGQFPQLINTQSAAEVLISGKASHTPLITEPCQIKPRNSMENPPQHCRASLLRQNNINAQVFDGGSPTEQQIFLSWEQALKVIIIKNPVCRKLGGSDWKQGVDLQWISARMPHFCRLHPTPETMISFLFFAPRTHSQELGDE